MKIVLRVACAVNEHGERLGWCAAAFKRTRKSLDCIELGHFKKYEDAVARIRAIHRYIADWELVAGYRYSKEEVAVKFAEADGLMTTWRVIPDPNLFGFTAHEYEISYADESAFRPDLTHEERLDLDALGIPELCGPQAVADQAGIERAQLGFELGDELTEADALSVAEGWPDAARQSRWAIEVVPAVGDQGEEVGFSVVGLIYAPDYESATIYDLSEPDISELHARCDAVEQRTQLHILLQIPYSLIHRDGIQRYFEQVRAGNRVDDAWLPFKLAGTDLTLFLAWGLPLQRGSMLLDGTLTRRELRAMLEAIAFEHGETVEENRELARLVGCQDREG